MNLKKLLLIGALFVGGIATTLAIPDTAEARNGRGRGYYGGRNYYRGYNYRPNYYRNYSYRPYSRNYNRSYYGNYYRSYPYSYGNYYRSYPYSGGYGGGVYIGRGGVSIGW